MDTTQTSTQAISLTGLRFTQRDARRLREAKAHHAAGRLAQARMLFEQILSNDPNNPDVLHRLGLLLDKQEEREAAVRHLTRAAELQPLRHEPIADLGITLSKMHRHQEAIDSLERAAELAPESAPVWFALGNAYLDAQRQQESIAPLRRATALDPGHYQAWSNLATMLRTLGRMEEALAAARQATTCRHADDNLQSNLGSLLLAAGDPAAAADALRIALEVNPLNMEAGIDLAAALLTMGEVDEALAINADLIEREPSTFHPYLNMGFCLLSLGRYPEGWLIYESRKQDPDLGLTDLPGEVWTGQAPLTGRSIRIDAEQGLGDTIMFIRYAPLLRERGARVVLSVQPPLVELLRPLGDEVVSNAAPRPECDLHCFTSSLPLAFRTTVETIPADIPYLSVPPARLATWQDRLGPRRGRRIGVSWSGNPDHSHDRYRSIPAERFITAVDLPGVELHLLQNSVRDPDLDAARRVISHIEALTDFVDSAALTSLMDLVITVDTAPAHLAGALGRPVWVLLGAGPDHRWLLNREDSPWYPTARLFRQTTFNVWDDVLVRVRDAVARLVAS